MSKKQFRCPRCLGKTPWNCSLCRAKTLKRLGIKPNFVCPTCQNRNPNTCPECMNRARQKVRDKRQKERGYINDKGEIKGWLGELWLKLRKHDISSLINITNEEIDKIENEDVREFLRSSMTKESIAKLEKELMDLFGDWIASRAEQKRLQFLFPACQ